MSDSFNLLAGSAAVDITPKVGDHLSGNIGLFRPAELALDRTFARAIVIQSSECKICLVSLDVTIITKDYADKIRDCAVELGFDRAAAMVFATQTHSAPGVGRFMLDQDFGGVAPEHEWIGGGEPAYSQFCIEGAIEALRKADSELRPVRTGAISGVEGRLAFNRRAIMKNGMVGMPGPVWQEPNGPDWIKYIEGPIDPEIGVVCLQDSNMRMVAVLSHYTCHPVHVFTKGRLVSADWPGVLCKQLEEAQDCPGAAMVLNGCCGNINPWDPFDPDYPNDHSVMGRKLAERAIGLLEKVEFEDRTVLGYQNKMLELPLREVSEQELAWADDLLQKHPEPWWKDDSRTSVEWDWMKAAGIKSVELIKRREQTLKYEIQVLRIGSLALVGLPGEPFVEGQLAIKLGSKARLTYVVHCCNHYVGYVPTSEAFARGGHEVDTSYWAKMVPGSLEAISECATNMIAEMF